MIWIICTYHSTFLPTRLESGTFSLHSWLIPLCVLSLYMTYHCTGLLTICDMTHSYTWYDSSIHVTWLIRMCDMTQFYVWHDSFLRVLWLLHTCDMPYSYTWRKRYLRIKRLLLTGCERGTPSLHSCLIHTIDIYVILRFLLTGFERGRPSLHSCLIPTHDIIHSNKSKNWNGWLWMVPKIGMNDVQKLEGMIMNYSKKSNDLNLWYDLMCDMT